jgi:glycosyltransferase involved in cell wall biosynthesis
MDLVSIIIPSYNRHELTAEAMRSCLSQDYPELQVVVVDDGSTDGSGEALKILSREDSRVVYVRQENAGQCAARNTGFRNSMGNLVKFLDSDDALTPGAIRAQVALMRETGAALVAGEVLGYDEGKLEAAQERWTREFAEQPDFLERIPLRTFIMHHRGTMNEVLMRRDVFERTGGFSEKLRAAEEINLLWRLYMALPELEVTRHSRRVYFKRLSLSSLAAQMRQQKTVPWALISTQETIQSMLDRAVPLDAELKQQLFDNFYRCIVFAYRNRQDSYIASAIATWQRGNVPGPRLQPWYHHWLHCLFGFRGGERALSAVRRALRGKT